MSLNSHDARRVFARRAKLFEVFFSFANPINLQLKRSSCQELAAAVVVIVILSPDRKPINNQSESIETKNSIKIVS